MLIILVLGMLVNTYVFTKCAGCVMVREGRGGRRLTSDRAKVAKGAEHELIFHMIIHHIQHYHDHRSEYT